MILNPNVISNFLTYCLAVVVAQISRFKTESAMKIATTSIETLTMAPAVSDTSSEIDKISSTTHASKNVKLRPVDTTLLDVSRTDPKYETRPFLVTAYVMKTVMFWDAIGI